MNVKKSDGRIEKFDDKKIFRTCRRAGLSPTQCSLLLSNVKKKIYDGITTKEIYKIVIDEIEKLEYKSKFIFGLREAMSKLTPEGFEKFVFKLLKEYGYECEWNIIIPGLYVEHQVDVVAKKNDKLFLVECKHHINYHRFCGLSNVLTVSARVEDINDGFVKGKSKYKFSAGWLFTNTKFSDHAKEYSIGKGIALTGWKYPPGKSLEKLIEAKKLYPLTVIDMSKKSYLKLQEAWILSVKDIVTRIDIVKSILGKKKAEEIYNDARYLV